MDQASVETQMKLRPVLVCRTKAARPDRKTALRSPAVLRQFDTVKQYAIAQGVAIEPSRVLVRTRAHYRPQHDRHLLDAIDHARAHFELLVLDDLFRLIDFRDPATAVDDIGILHACKMPLFSVLHGLPLWGMTHEFLAAQIGDGVRAFRRQSDSVRAGIARNRLPDATPSRRGAEAGARMKKRLADARAGRLIAEIDRVRSGLEPDRRTNLAAIAAALNAERVPTPSGRGRWQGVTVRRILDRTGDRNGDGTGRSPEG